MWQIQLYFKQAWNLIKQERLFSLIYIAGTAMAIAMVMMVAIGMHIMLGNVYPETNRDRMLVASKAGIRQPGGSSMVSSFSEKTLRTCFSDMKGVEAFSILRGNEGGIVQQSGLGLTPIEVQIKWVDVAYWKVFDFHFVCGKPFSEADFQSRIRAVVISETLARQVFGTTEVVGRDISFNYYPYRICGVVKDASVLTPYTYAQVWAPYTVRKDYRPDEAIDNQGVIGGYKGLWLVSEDADVREVQKEARERMHRFARSLPEGYEFYCGNRPDTFVENYFHEGSSEEIDYTMIFLQGALLVLMLLVVPAINLSGMTDSRMERRLAEIGVRRSFGAPVHTVIMQVISENLLFTLLGGGLGLLLSYVLLVTMGEWFLRLFLNNPFFRGEIQLLPDMLLNPAVFLLALGACFLLNLISALIPAWKTSRHPIVESLRPQSGLSVWGSSSWMNWLQKNAWVGLELALVFGLVWFFTGELFNQAYNRNIPVSRNIDKVWRVDIDLLPPLHTEYREEADRPEVLLDDLWEIVGRIRRNEKVEEVALLLQVGMPYGFSYSSSVYRNPVDTTRVVSGEIIGVVPETDFFKVFGYTTADGKPVSVKDFDWSDPNAFVVAQMTADLLYPGEKIQNKEIEKTWGNHDRFRILGAVGNCKRFDYQRPQHAFYVASRVTAENVRSTPHTLAIRLKPSVSEADFAEVFQKEMGATLRVGNFYLRDVKSFRQQKEETETEVQATTAMVQALMYFFLLNIILCVTGTFWYRVRMRREEIGIRMAMGASKQAVRRMLFKEGLQLLGVAALIAMGIEVQLVVADIVPYGVPDGEVRMYFPDYTVAYFLFVNLLTGLLLAGAILLAIWIPANRAVRMLPADALHED